MAKIKMKDNVGNNIAYTDVVKYFAVENNMQPRVGKVSKVSKVTRNLAEILECEVNGHSHITTENVQLIKKAPKP